MLNKPKKTTEEIRKEKEAANKKTHNNLGLNQVG